MRIRSSRVVFPDGTRPGLLYIENGRFSRIAPGTAVAPDADTLDMGDFVVMPGLVDTHVHINEPGRTDWEGFETATQAAAAGGITTLVDMPLNSVPPTVTARALAMKRAAGNGRCRVNVAFWGGVVPGNTAELEALWNAGVPGFKCFLCPSGVDEFGHVSEADLRTACAELARLDAPLLAHAEDPAVLATARASSSPGRWTRYDDYLSSRPEQAEVTAIDLLVRLAREFGTRVHVVHVASAEALDVIDSARAAGLPITAETCPHYLTFDADAIPDEATEYKCAPPIRRAASRTALWKAAERGTLSAIVTDHSPSPPALKLRESGDFRLAWGGIASLQLSLPIVWTTARERGWSPERLAAMMCRGPAALARLEARGAIEVGNVADLVVWDPDASFEVDPAALHHRHKLTPYAGRRLVGRIRCTFVRGELVFADDEMIGSPRGELLERGRAGDAQGRMTRP